MDDKIYPDTLKGAIQALDDMSTLDMTNMTGYPDPHVDGVWKIEHPGQVDEPEAVASIVYLAGYEDPYGNIRQYNDFETEIDTSLYGEPKPNYDESEPDNYEEDWGEGHDDDDDDDDEEEGDYPYGEEFWTDFRLDAEPELFNSVKSAAERGDDPKKLALKVLDALVDFRLLKSVSRVDAEEMQSLVDYIAAFDKTAE